MPKQKQYFHYMCKDCEVDFLVGKSTKNQNYRHCPVCGEYFEVEKIRNVWIDRPFNYMRAWTNEEDSFIVFSIMEGFTHQQIADNLEGRTKKAVSDRVIRLRKSGVYYDLSSMWKKV
jgi:DNA-directed RNA polymerase subunit RPC12/RpoP